MVAAMRTGGLVIVLALLATTAFADERGGWLCLFNGQDLHGWQHARDAEAENHWFVDEDRSLTNVARRNDLATVGQWRDFELKLEYKTVEGGNSGVYLRGRVEIQVLDSSGREEPGTGDDGAIYGLVPPRVLASRPIGEWNELYVKFVGDRVTATLNGQVIHEDQEVERVTGGALPGDLMDPGPLMLQGDHGKVWYRNIKLRPLD